MLLEALVIVLILLVLVLYSHYVRYKSLFEQERASKTSLAVKHGLTFEQLVPFTKEFPGNPRDFRFIGDPIDGIVFGDGEITFVEFKYGRSSLSEKQKNVRNLVKEKRIAWKEVNSSREKSEH